MELTRKTDLTIDYWENAYQATEYLYGKEPSKFLQREIANVTKGHILDVGCGEGQNSVFLASKGFEVTGFDFSQTAIDRAEKLISDSGQKATLKKQDIDLYLLPLMTFDAILLANMKASKRFFTDINRGLKQGGTLIVDAFTAEHIRKNGKPKVDYSETYELGELLRLAPNLRIEFFEEREISPNCYKVQMIAKKVGLF